MTSPLLAAHGGVTATKREAGIGGATETLFGTQPDGGTGRPRD